MRGCGGCFQAAAPLGFASAFLVGNSSVELLVAPKASLRCGLRGAGASGTSIFFTAAAAPSCATFASRVTPLTPVAIFAAMFFVTGRFCAAPAFFRIFGGAALSFFAAIFVDLLAVVHPSTDMDGKLRRSCRRKSDDDDDDDESQSFEMVACVFRFTGAQDWTLLTVGKDCGGGALR